MKATILGGGFAGCTVARLLTDAGWECTLIEKEAHLGGGCWTYFYGGHPYTLGPRVYYGYSEKVWTFLNSIIPMRRFPFELLTYVEQERRFFSYPIHEDDIQFNSQRDLILSELAKRDNTREPRDFEEYWLQRVGRTLYDHFVNRYSKKMWMIDDNRIFDIFKWSAKDRAIEPSGSTREAYKGSYIGYPVAADGYNSYFHKMTKGVDVRYGATLQPGELPQADVVISTIPIDEFMGYQYGELPYAGRDFTVFILPVRQAFPGDVRFCHYAGTEPHTRITEFKKITYHESSDSLFVLETPSKRNKLYPYLTRANEALVARYKAALPANTHSIGRLGTYKYTTIEQTIVQAHKCSAEILGTPNALADQWRGIGDVAMMAKDRKESA